MSQAMPIYEYEPIDLKNSCDKCRDGFEFMQAMSDAPLTQCPQCGGQVTKIVSWCRSAVVEDSPEHAHISRKIAAYEKECMWSHAAELADTHAERVKDNRLKMRAIENYEKAGYAPANLEKHAKTDVSQTDS